MQDIKTDKFILLVFFFQQAMNESFRRTAKKVWHFIWDDDSIWSWILNVILAFILIKFLVYPGLGFALSTSHPIVAVVSGSMEHDLGFCQWWTENRDFYKTYNISEEDFDRYRYTNGFNTGDIMILRGTDPKNVEVGDVVVFWASRPDPIIHRVIRKWTVNGRIYFQTKGDNNPGSNLDERNIPESSVVGKAVIRIPFLGWVKIMFVNLIGFIGGIL